jgi:hypothetical protein
MICGGYQTEQALIFRVKVAEIYLIGAIGVENLDFAGDRLG